MLNFRMMMVSEKTKELEKINVLVVCFLDGIPFSSSEETGIRFSKNGSLSDARCFENAYLFWNNKISGVSLEIDSSA